MPESSSTQITSQQIRQQFVDYFIDKHAHTHVPSSPAVPHDDPTLLFANAGMNQFKDVFLGTGRREYSRAVNSQKCIRAGGKHNDLEDVGKDTYHHTFFEMLGNWSFGDYFKREAIEWAWDLLTNVWGLDKSRLHVTVFEGDESEGLAADEEAANLWREVTDIDPSHIHYGSKKDNFWEMGDTGPCGPCSEIHIDRSPNNDCSHLVNGDDARVIEIWNLVFIEFNRTAGGKLVNLPAKHVDTGMGFERLCAVLQDKTSNYDTDVFTPLFDAIQKVTGARQYDSAKDDSIDVAYRVIADHVRCLTFALTDGAVPSNEGRGYVLRRILRRAVRHGRQTLGVKDPFLYKLVGSVVEQMKPAFPELEKNPARVAELIKEEEESFHRTLDRGIELFEQAAAKNNKKITGEDAFTLYDTYGFPLDLTEVMAEERGMTVDFEQFEKLMEQARERSRAGGTGGADVRQSLVDIVQQHDLPETEFVGYDQTELIDHTTPVHVFRHAVEGGYAPADRADTGDQVAIVTDRTPFYAEAGGQVGDSGTITINDTTTVAVSDTLKVGGASFHIGKVTAGKVETAESANVSFRIDADRRSKIMANHTTTHMMNRALRKFVNAEADQRGSLVDDAKLRFDFSHNAPVKLEQIAQVVKQVNDDIAAGLPVYYDYAPQEKAREIRGLRAVFGEKYPPKVRVVSIGVPVDQLLAEPGREDWPGYSIEFCGGTHLKNTRDAESFAIVSEEGVAKGVRRITALTGEAAQRAHNEGEQLIAQMNALLDAGDNSYATLVDDVADLTNALAQQTLPANVTAKLRDGIAQLQAAIKKIEKQRSEQAQADIVDVAKQIADNASGDVIVENLGQADGNALRKAMDVIKHKHPEAALFLGSVSDDKVALVAAVPKPMIERGLKAGDWVREVAKVVGGGGGGRPDMAQAGGKDPAKLDEALETAKTFAAGKLA